MKYNLLYRAQVFPDLMEKPECLVRTFKNSMTTSKGDKVPPHQKIASF